MKLKDLKQIVDAAMKNERNHDREVCIPNNKGGWGGTSVTAITGAAEGIDWDKKKFIFWPEVEMVERKRMKDD